METQKKFFTALASSLNLRGKLIAAVLFVVGLAVLSSTMSLTWIVDTEMQQQVFDNIDAVSANN